MKANIEKFYALNVKNVLLKGGHLSGNEIIDLLLEKKLFINFYLKR